jgi:hypothetical protein
MKTFNSLVSEYLGGDLSHELAEGVEFSILSSAAQDFILRTLRLMRQAGQSATDFSPYHTWELSTVIPRILPDSLGGIIPPFTNPGRHTVFDKYIRKKLSVPRDQKAVLIDIGCGFPPLTTIDTSRNLPDWKVFGIDQRFAPFVVIDPDGHYGCFSKDGTFQYMQPRFGAPDTNNFYTDHISTQNRFKTAFDKLCPLLKTADNTNGSYEKDGYKLTQNPIKEFETEQLTFHEADIEKCQLPFAHVVRCMNVLVYFKAQDRMRMIAQAGRKLQEGGIFMAGTNHGSGSYRRYVIYQKQGDHLLPTEFAFSIDVLRSLSVVPWFTIHDDDTEATLLAELAYCIRSNSDYWHKFSARVDFLFEQHDICLRNNKGFLEDPKVPKPRQEQRKLHSDLWQKVKCEGFIGGAVDALCTAGYNGFENVVGDIAIRPGGDSGFLTLPLV